MKSVHILGPSPDESPTPLGSKLTHFVNHDVVITSFSVMLSSALTPLPLGALPFSPLYILFQILFLQSLFYLFFVFFVTLLCALAVRPPTLDFIFAAATYSLESIDGFVAIIAHLLVIIPLSLAFSFVVERSKLCLDFSFTLIAIHIALSSTYWSFPTTATWWFVTAIFTAALILASETMCRRREARAVPLSGASNATSFSGGGGAGEGSAGPTLV